MTISRLATAALRIELLVGARDERESDPQAISGASPTLRIGDIAREAVQIYAETRAVCANGAYRYCAVSPASIPVSTSPVPPVAMPGFPVELMHALPSGAATTVCCPFRITIAFQSAAAFSATSTRRACTSFAVAASQSRHFARMRRHASIPFASRQFRRSAGECIQSVGVQHDRDTDRLLEPPRERIPASRPASRAPGRWRARACLSATLRKDLLRGSALKQFRLGSRRAARS